MVQSNIFCFYVQYLTHPLHSPVRSASTGVLPTHIPPLFTGREMRVRRKQGVARWGRGRTDSNPTYKVPDVGKGKREGNGHLYCSSICGRNDANFMETTWHQWGPFVSKRNSPACCLNGSMNTSRKLDALRAGHSSAYVSYPRQLLNSSKPPFLHLQNGDNTTDLT